jgi:hypothetical protein
MPSVSFKRVRAEVTDVWSGEPTDDATLVQKVAEYRRSPGFPPYPAVQKVHPELGVWDLYLPEDLVQELVRQGAHEFEFEETDRYSRVRFLDRDKETREESEGSGA